VIFTIFINSGIKNGSVSDLLTNKLQKGEERDRKRETDFIEECNEERAD
jgi:hypothetical protein